MTIDRNVHLTNDTLTTFEEALAWVVKAHDREFAECDLINVQISKGKRLDEDSQDQWSDIWQASIGGSLQDEEEEDEDYEDQEFHEQSDSS
jgi:hypothetical protein